MTLSIERIETHLVATPLEPPIVHPFLGARTRFCSLVVLVHTRGGPTGYGYMTGESPRQMAAIRCIVEDLAERLVAERADARRHAFLYERMWNWTVDLLHEGAATLALGEWLRSEGTAWASSSVWRGRAVVRFAVSNFGTDAEAVRRSIDAVARGAAALGLRG